MSTWSQILVLLVAVALAWGIIWLVSEVLL